MKVIEPGHVYLLDTFDSDGEIQGEILTFVNRESLPGPHSGTQTQEVLRATVDVMSVLIDRTNHCDACLRWEGNDRIIKALSEAQRQMRLAILLHEQRALERKMEKEGLEPEKLPTGEDGHFKVERQHRWVVDQDETYCKDPSCGATGGNLEARNKPCPWKPQCKSRCDKPSCDERCIKPKDHDGYHTCRGPNAERAKGTE